MRVGVNGENTRIGYNFKKSILSDGSNPTQLVKTDLPENFTASAPPDADGRVCLRIYVDESQVDVFGGDGRVRLSSWIFPSPASDGIDLFSDGGRTLFKSVKVSRLTSIWRPTVPDDGPVEKVLLPVPYIKIPVGQPLTLTAALLPCNATDGVTI